MDPKERRGRLPLLEDTALEKAMLLFPCGGPCEQCSDSLKDPVETAMFGAPGIL